MAIKKSFLHFLCLLFISIFTSCSQNKKEFTDCEISGTVEGKSYSHGIVYLKNVAKHEIIDSTHVKNGTFYFRGLKTDSVYAALLLLKSSSTDDIPLSLPIIIEPGRLEAEIKENSVCVSGSSLNESLQDFLEELDDFSDHVREEKYSLEQTKKEFSEFLTSQINSNKDNAVGEYIRQAYASRLNPPADK